MINMSSKNKVTLALYRIIVESECLTWSRSSTQNLENAWSPAGRLKTWSMTITDKAHVLGIGLGLSFAPVDLFPPCVSWNIVYEGCWVAISWHWSTHQSRAQSVFPFPPKCLFSWLRLRAVVQLQTAARDALLAQPRLGEFFSLQNWSVCVQEYAMTQVHLSLHK